MRKDRIMMTERRKNRRTEERKRREAEEKAKLEAERLKSENKQENCPVNIKQEVKGNARNNFLLALAMSKI